MSRSHDDAIAQGKQALEKFKHFFSPQLYMALEEPMALALIANNQINLDRIKSSAALDEQCCYSFSFLFNEHGYQALSKNHISTDAFLTVPTHERYTLHFLFKDGQKFLENGDIDLQKFLAIPEKKRLSYIDNLKYLKT